MQLGLISVAAAAVAAVATDAAAVAAADADRHTRTQTTHSASLWLKTSTGPPWRSHGGHSSNRDFDAGLFHLAFAGLE